MQQIIVNILLSFSLYLLIAKSFSIIYCTTHFFHIAHAITLTLSAYFVYMFSFQLNINMAISVILAVICATVIGMMFEIFLYKPLRKRKASSLILMITSLSIYTVIQNIISMIWSNSTKSIRFWEVSIGYDLFGSRITNVQIVMLLVCLILFTLSALFMNYTRIGRNIRAVSSNAELSNIIGIPSDIVILWTFVIGSFLVAVVGILISFDLDIRPTMGFTWLLYGVVAMIVGGIGSNWSLACGAFLLAAAQHSVAYLIGSQWIDAIAYIILILFLIAKPLGLSGKRLKKVEL